MTYAGSPAIYRKTKDIRLTQRFARHKSILTTAIYSHPTDEDLLRAVTGLPC
jgi:site-specific recombinase XerD